MLGGASDSGQSRSDPHKLNLSNFNGHLESALTGRSRFGIEDEPNQSLQHGLSPDPC